MLRAAFVFALLVGIAVAQEPYLAQLRDARLEKPADLLNADRTALNLEQEEVRYQGRAQARTLADLAEIYSPDNSERLQVAYVSFTPDAMVQLGDDRGYGFHIVKRLDLPLPNGETKTI